MLFLFIHYINYFPFGFGLLRTCIEKQLQYIGVDGSIFSQKKRGV